MSSRSRFDEPTLGWLDALTDDGRVVVMVRDEHRQTVYVSPNVEHVTGWPADAFVDRLHRLAHSDDQTALFETSRRIRESDADKGEVPVRVLVPDGGFRWYLCRFHNRLHDPAVRGVVSQVEPLGSDVSTLDRHFKLLATTSDVVVVLDAELRPDYVSPSVERILGMTPAAFARDWRAIAHEDDLDVLDRAHRRVRATPGGETNVRIRAWRTDGALRIFDAVVANRLDDESINGILVSGRDVTDLVEAEERLGRSETQFEVLVDTSPDVFMLFDESATVLFASAGIETITGRRAEEIVGSSAFALIHEDDVPRSAAELERILTVGGKAHVVLRARHPDRGHTWIEASAVNHLDTPGLNAIVVSMRDVTERVEEQHRMERLLRDSASVAFVVDRELNVTWTTPGVERFIGTERQLRVDVVRELLELEDGMDPIAVFEEVVAGGPGTSRRAVGHLTRGEERRWIDLKMTNTFDDPAIDGVIVKVRDVDDAVRASEAGQRLSQVLGNTTDVVSIHDPDLTMVWANPAAVAVLGEPPLPIGALWKRTPAWARTVIEREALPLLEGEGVWRGELAMLTPDGDEVPLESSMLVHRTRDGEIGFISVMSRDISDRKALESRLHAKARTDPLTGLPNRTMLTERLGDVLAARDVRAAVAFIDIDQFKSVNDTQGHDAGDELLVAIADRLRSSVRASDLVARFGGDEFVVVLADVADSDTARMQVERILAGLRGSVRAGAIDVFVTASAGVALSDSGGATDVISNADAAMYAAKSAGRDQVAVYSDELRARSVLHLETAHDLRAGIETEAIEVWYQPIVATGNGRPVSMEGLVRWRHPELGVLPPGRFVPIAEETGLILPLGEAVIRKACNALATLGDDASGCTLSVNLSAHQLADPNLPDVLAACIEDHDVAPGRLICEITESAVMQDVSMSAQMLEQIRALGVGIAVDDFGTGYSSLAYLHRFPVDILKIDREFINDLSPEMDWTHSLAAGIISLAHSLDLVVVAEGVETELQADILRQLDCDTLQGYLYARPAPVHEIGGILRSLHTAADTRHGE